MVLLMHGIKNLFDFEARAEIVQNSHQATN
jgi:hypothetical protein